MHVTCSGEGVSFPIDDELAIDTVQGGARSDEVTDDGVIVRGPRSSNPRTSPCTCRRVTSS